MARSQGAAAVYSGHVFRDVVAAVGEITLNVTPYRNHKSNRRNQYGDKIKVGIYFPIRHPTAPDGLYVECQRQETSGSAERKVESLCIEVSRYYDRPTLLVIDGEASDKMCAVAKRYVGEGNLVGIRDFYGFWRYCDGLMSGDECQPQHPSLFSSARR